MEEERKPEQTESAEAVSAPSAAPEQESPGQPEEDFQSLIRGRCREDYLHWAAALLAEQAQQTNRYLAYRELRRQAETLKETYPDFDLNRELEDPTFLRLIRGRVDPATAYEVVHRRQLAEESARRERIRRHPVENGLTGGASPAVLQTDPRALSREERKQLRRRAARGEEIVW